MARKKYLEGVVTDCKKLNIRSEPSMDGGAETIVKVIDALTDVMVMPISGMDDWYKVKVGEIRGYCMSKYIAVKKGE